MPIDSSIYGNLQTGSGIGKLGPADILNMANQANQLSLFPLQKQRMEIENATNQFNLQAGQNQFLRDGIGALAGKGNSLTKKDVTDFIVAASRNTNIPTSVLSTYMDGVPDDPKQLINHVRNLQNIAIGSGGTAARVPGPPGLGGAPTTAPLGQVNYGGGAMPVGLAPGVAARQEGAAATDVRLADNLAHEAEGSQQRRALLGNIMDLSDKFEPGPGASQSKEFKAFVNRNIPLPEGWKFDKKSIADQEEFAKQAATFAQKQFDTIGGTGTDAKFNSAFTVSPNEALSKMGVKNISRLLLGNEDAIQAKNKAWLDRSASDPNLSYRRFSQEFHSHFDPRVFQFKYVPAKERQDYFDKLQPEDQSRLLHDMTYARKQGWVKY